MAVWRDRLTEFGDCLQVGLLVCVASVPVVTAAPAFAAGCSVVRRWRDGDYPPLLPFFRDEFRRHLRGGILFTLLALVAGLVVATDIVAVRAGAPGSGALSVVLAVVAAFLAVVVLRTCAVVSICDGWVAAVRLAARVRPGSSVLLVAAVLTAGVLVWMQPLMVFLVAGPLALAAVGANR
ncbi:DUF624 domain-containing protein [Kibdelosporangium lantanae]